MYLSKIACVPSNHMAEMIQQLDRNGAYASHQLLWRLFTQHHERQFIFRQEQDSSGRPLFYVVSQSKPDDSSAPFQIETKPFMPKLYQGQRLAFKLRANPTVCISDKNGRSKRHDVMMHAKMKAKAQGLTDSDVKQHMNNAAQQWLGNDKRLANWGIKLETTPDIEAYTQQQSVKKSGHKIQLSMVDYQGILSVMEPDKFLLQYGQGFGRAKALGCGLMLLRPV